MKVDEKNEHLDKKMTLRDYYESLPSSSHPKTEFVNDIAVRAGVSTTTVRNWIVYGMKPINPEHVEILSQATGIEKDCLWND